MVTKMCLHTLFHLYLQSYWHFLPRGCNITLSRKHMRLLTLCLLKQPKTVNTTFRTVVQKGAKIVALQTHKLVAMLGKIIFLSYIFYNTIFLVIYLMTDNLKGIPGVF